MAKKRDYRQEYRRRIDRGLAKDLTRAEARGHGARPSRSGMTSKHAPSERALLDMMDGLSLAKAAKRHRLSRERLRRYLKEQTSASYKGGKWTIREKQPLALRAIVDGRLTNLSVNRRGATVISGHWRGVGLFLRAPTPANLAAIQGLTVRDVRGKPHHLEDRPNVLRRLASADELSFLSIYADTPAGASP